MKISVLIPCYNEEKTICMCVESALFQTRPPDQIVVVDDASEDASSFMLEQFGDAITVVRTPRNMGNKSYAQEYGLKYITGDIVVTTDGDTFLAPDFLERMERRFADGRVAAVAGYIVSAEYNWLTALRELEYVIGQDVYKTAQSYLRSLLVIPGCAAAFRTRVLKHHVRFDHDTVTEDLDFTYKLHRHGYSILYDRGARVFTQDPFTFRSYVNQVRRWMRGGWQNLAKHWPVVFERPGHALEISFFYFEGLIFGALFFILPFIHIGYFGMFVGAYSFMAFVFGCYAGCVRGRLDVFLYAPLFPFLLMVNSWILLEQFFAVIVLRRKNLTWYRPERADEKYIRPAYETMYKGRARPLTHI